MIHSHKFSIAKYNSRGLLRLALTWMILSYLGDANQRANNNENLSLWSHEYNRLEEIFGGSLIQAHFSSPWHFMKAVHRESSIIHQRNQSSSHILCYNSTDSESVLFSVQTIFGEDHIFPLTSKGVTSQGSECFWVVPSCSLKRAEGDYMDSNIDIISKSQNLVYYPIPLELKVSSHIISVLDWLHKGVNIPTDNLGKLLWDTYDRSNLKLAVSYFPNHPKDIDLLTYFREKLSFCDGIYLDDTLHYLASPYSNHTFGDFVKLAPDANHWLRASHIHTRFQSNSSFFDYTRHYNNNSHNNPKETLSSSICPFSNLQLTNNYKNPIIIENFHILLDSEEDSAYYCLTLLLAILVAHPNTHHIHFSADLKIQNDFVTQAIESGNFEDGNIFAEIGLVGADVIVGVADTGVDEQHCFFDNPDGRLVSRSTSSNPITDFTRRKIVQYVNYTDDLDDLHGHGTHVCGTLAGVSSDINGNYNGVATGSKIVFFDIQRSGSDAIQIPDIDDVLFPVASRSGAALHSNSWGGGSDLYDYRCVAVDNYLYNNLAFLAFFAAGNADRTQSSLIVPALSKNAVAVGSVGTGRGQGLSVLSQYTSWGPAPDGRYGVDVLAPGGLVMSAAASGQKGVSSCGITSKVGTSMATPGVAGAAALIQQYFKDSKFWAAICRQSYIFCQPFTPSGSIVKAMLIQSGEDVGGGHRFPGPEQGFGRINLKSVLPSPSLSASFDLYVEDIQLLKYSFKKYFVHVSDANQALKATICWMDPVNPVARGSARQLVNDIDLIIKSPDGLIYYGNGGSGKDSLNNVEMINITAPVTGTYLLTVSTELLYSASQQVSLVVTCGGSVSYATDSPSQTPSSPTAAPTSTPSSPTSAPTTAPSSPSSLPSVNPTSPTAVPSVAPSSPTPSPHNPTTKPSLVPSFSPSRRPIKSSSPTLIPQLQTNSPSKSPRPNTNVTRDDVSSAMFFVPYFSEVSFAISASVLFCFCLCFISCVTYYSYSLTKTSHAGQVESVTESREDDTSKTENSDNISAILAQQKPTSTLPSEYVDRFFVSESAANSVATLYAVYGGDMVNGRSSSESGVELYDIYQEKSQIPSYRHKL